MEAIKLFRECLPEGIVFVYIGWLEGTLDKLKNYNFIPNDKLIVSNQLKDMVDFLKQQGVKQKWLLTIYTFQIN